VVARRLKLHVSSKPKSKNQDALKKPPIDGDFHVINFG
jgi:hypothetical protein